MATKSAKGVRVPRLCERKSQATGRTIFYATFNGRFFSFGGDRKRAEQQHAELGARWLANGQRLPDDGAEPAPYLVEDLIGDYMAHAAKHYHDAATGQASGEYHNVRLALQPVLDLFGSLPAAEVGGIALQAVRQAMVDGGKLCRREVNARVHRIRRAFRWAAGMQLVPESMVGSMALVEGLKAGRTTARESEPVLPIAEAEVRAVTAQLCPTVAGVVWFQWWTGCRPGEACALRWGMIDRSGPVWIAELERHKTAHRGRRRVLAIGPRAQDAIRPLMVVDPRAFVFSPQRAVEEQRAAKRARRRSKVPPSQRRRAEIARARPREEIGESFTVETLRRAIAYGVAGANAAMLRGRVLEVLARHDGDAAATARRRFERLATRRLVSVGGRLLLTETTVGALVDGAELAAAVWDACSLCALLEPWGPNRLRHSAATRLRREEGLEAARVVLGHARAAVTEVYAEADHERSRAIMARHG
jgi:integrase